MPRPHPGPLWYSAGGGNYLRVNRGPYAYVVFSAFGRWGKKTE